LITHSFHDFDAGVLKSGKEAEVFLVERTSAEGSCLLAHKRYRPRYPGAGELRALGFSKGTIYRADKVYRAGWNLNRRDRLHAESRSRSGSEMAAGMWPANEVAMLRRAWDAGASVPYPVDRTDDGLLMEFIGGRNEAAPRLVNAHLDAHALRSARDQLLDSLAAMSSAHVVHGDLSSYNILWWRGRLVVIDFPQAVDATTNPHAPDLLARDIANVAGWFERQRVPIDVDELYGELLGLLFGGADDGTDGAAVGAKVGGAVGAGRTHSPRMS